MEATLPLHQLLPLVALFEDRVVDRLGVAMHHRLLVEVRVGVVEVLPRRLILEVELQRLDPRP